MLSILIVNWNTRELLRACLTSLQRWLCDDYEIIVVDNASNDASAAMVQEEFPQVHLIASTENLGYAAGNNRALAAARGEWIWLLNPDTEIFESSFAALRDFMQAHPQCGAAASLLEDALDHSTQQSCRTFPSPAALWSEALGLARLYPRSRRFGFYRMGWWNYGEARQVDQPMASSLLLRRAAVEEIGDLFDEAFPIYFNDVDLCWRLREAHWEIWFVPDSRVLHHGGAATRQRRPAMIAESHRCLALFYQKHYRERLHPLLYFLTQQLVRLSGKWRVQRAVKAQHASEKLPSKNPP